jgi:hypothetical protein
MRRRLESKGVPKEGTVSETKRGNAAVEPVRESPFPVVQRAGKTPDSAAAAEARTQTTPDPRVRRLPAIRRWRESAAEERQPQEETARWPQPPIPLFSEPRDGAD